MTTASSEPTLERAYEILASQLKKKPDGQKKIMAHLRSVTGKSIALPLYHNDQSIAEDTKKALYKLFVKALLNNDYSHLQGQGSGERVDPVEAAQKIAAVQATTPTPPPESTGLAPLEAQTITPTPKPVNTKANSSNTDSGLINALLTALGPYIDEIVDRRIAARMSNGGFPEDRVRGVVNDVLKARFS